MFKTFLKSSKMFLKVFKMSKIVFKKFLKKC